MILMCVKWIYTTCKVTMTVNPIKYVRETLL